MKKLACLLVLLGVCVGSFAQSPSPAPSSTPSAPKPAASPAAKPYPLKTCLVSGEKLGGGAMGEPYKFDYKGQLIVLCCKSCLKKFNKEPEKYLKKLERAEPK